MCVKDFLYFVSHDRDVSTEYCRSSLGDSVKLLSRTTTVVVGDWLSQTLLMVGGSGSKACVKR